MKNTFQGLLLTFSASFIGLSSFLYNRGIKWAYLRQYGTKNTMKSKGIFTAQKIHCTYFTKRKKSDL
jgi:hypothetical protein